MNLKMRLKRVSAKMDLVRRPGIAVEVLVVLGLLVC